MNFKIKTSILKEPLAALSVIEPEVNFQFTKEGMKIVSWGKAKIMMVIFFVAKHNFIEYKVNEERMGISLLELTKILKKSSTDSTLEFEEKENLITLNIDKKKYTMGIVDCDHCEKEPKEDTGTKVTLEVADIYNSIDESSFTKDEGVSIRLEKDKLIIKSQEQAKSFSSEIESAKIENFKEDKKSRFSRELLMLAFNKKVSDKAEVFIDTDFPLTVAYSNEEFVLKIIIAPRVEVENNNRTKSGG